MHGLFTQLFISMSRNLDQQFYKVWRSLSASSPSSSAEDTLYFDLQRLHLQLQQFQSQTENHMKEINNFERSAKDDFQRIWDNLNELQEVTNITQKNMEDIYDKDILPLQNFKTSTENEIKKLRDELDEFLLDLNNAEQSNFAANSGGNFLNGSSDEAIKALTKTKRRLDQLEDEQSRHSGKFGNI